ncbi:murein hydrolase activator EnvC family protein [Candidatus Sororendozoicomonas aggregata]|uniref:murein hydrolase activator EnvC family protein n=1 Tax=Candidatus Sororendozoicomonas aggregata TaxID=3073239 RepID=UPI002ED5B469
MVNQGILGVNINNWSFTLSVMNASVFILTVFLAGLGVNSTYAESKAEPKVSQTQAAIDAVARDITQLKNTLISLSKEHTLNEKRLLREEKAISGLQREVRAIQEKIKEGEQSITALKQRQTFLQQQKQAEKKRIAKSLRSMYLISGEDRIKLFLNQEDPEQISRQMVYLEYLQEAQLAALQRFEAILTEAKTNQQQQEALGKSLTQKKQQLELRQKKLVAQRRNRETLLKRLSAERSQGQDRLVDLEEQQKALETALASLKSRGSGSGIPFSKMKGKLSWPVKGTMLSGYNDLRSDTGLRWKGLLISAPVGEPITAVNDGRVIFADWLRGYGLLAIVDHGNDYLTLYAHNASLLKEEGEVVLAGEPLARVGSTGGQSQPSLYFEIRHKGIPIDPSQWLSR